MKTLRGAEADVLLNIDETLVDQLRLMASQGDGLEKLIQFLADRKTPKGGAMIALRRAGVASANEVKKAVHFHAAYAYRREEDNVFEESVVQDLQKIERSEAAA
ncbi:hypothetical protein [Terriglobus sp. RCC_193]|uniref:hypothetical protein n=1 Tax=Terriglobus sp. RCC_193 TaxID=3239218 RepID=UPI003524849D